MHLTTEWFGSFLTDKGRLVKSSLFPKSPEEIAARLLALDDGVILGEEKELVDGLGGVTVLEERLLSIPGATLSKSGPSHRSEAERLGYSQELFHDSSLVLAKHKTARALAGRDKHIVQAVTTFDELTNIANLGAERLREWYGLHSPELVEKVERHEELATLVSSLGNRDAIAGKEPRYHFPQGMGADLQPPEEATLRQLARLVSSVYSTRAEIEKYLNQALPAVAPNVTALVGAPIAARLIKQAGGLDSLARLPSGTIQTLGAEKALFRHLKDGNRPPKHGTIFQHPLIHKSDPRLRGRIARLLSARLAIAARANAHTREDLSRKLVDDFERKALAMRPRRLPPQGHGAPPTRRPAATAKKGRSR